MKKNNYPSLCDFAPLREVIAKLTFAISFVVLALTAVSAADKRNVLFIAIDDLRPELGCYGSPTVKSPNLDGLAAEGLRFERAYCQQAICSPSRASLLSGMRPDETGITHNYVQFRDLNPDAITIPMHFMAHGYETVSSGKIFHRPNDDPQSWSRGRAIKQTPFKKPNYTFALPENHELHMQQRKEMFEKYGEASKRGLASGPAYESADVPDHAYIDGWNTQVAIATLKEMVKEDEKPFFLALGFKLPHLNWCAPKKYWDLYDRDEIELASQAVGPEGGAMIGLHPSFELRVRANIPKFGPMGEDLSRTLLHAYYASVSYVDAQVGHMLKALDEAGVRDNTIIIVWGDHGWHLGEMGIWGKATNYEISTRVPLILSTPDMKAKGKGTNALVELVDIYPTLCELAGLPEPDHLAGKSFAALLDDPDLEIKDFALSQFPSPALREWAANPLSPEMRETFFGPLIEQVEERIIKQQGDLWDRELFESHLMGYSLRTDRFRFVTWLDSRDLDADPVFVELFDHETDPTETKNIAAENAEVVAKLSEKLRSIVIPLNASE
ncbi:MAG: sulfatase [Verrucomicrobiales bacterium]|nr:sulfatase [Verrucomicrobiales bacterium]